MPDSETIRASLTALADAPGLLAGDAVGDLVPRLWPYSFTYLWSALRIDGRDATFAERFERVRGVAYSTSPWRPEGWDDNCEALLVWLAAVDAGDVAAATERLAHDPEFVRSPPRGSRAGRRRPRRDGRPARSAGRADRGRDRPPRRSRRLRSPAARHSRGARRLPRAARCRGRAGQRRRPRDRRRDPAAPSRALSGT